MDELIVKQFTDLLSSEEENQLNNWIGHSEENKTYYKQMQKVWNASDNFMAFDAVDVDADYDLFAQKVGFAKNSKVGINRFLNIRNIAAVLLPLIGLSIAFTLYQTTPGFGKWVAFNSSDEVTSIVLPDQSMVDLNTHSKLIYEKTFDGKQRKLKLQGEGYFKVTKNPDQPFIVKVGQAEVKVLGTAFYLEEKGTDGATNLIVTEGRVSFSSGDKEVFVSKGESATLINGSFEKKNQLPLNQMSWRTGVIEFEKSNFDQVIRTILDHFSEEIEKIDNQSKDTDRVITTKFESPTLEEVLVELRIHFDKKFTLDGKKLVISD